MHPASLLAALRTRGIALHPTPQGLKYEAPRGALTPELRAGLVAHKKALIALLHLDERRRLYRDLAQDIGNAADCEAVRWLTDHGHVSVVGQLLDLDARCAELVRTGAAEAELRSAVGRFVARVREMRRLYREARLSS